MIFLDANYFLRWLMSPVSPGDVARHTIATSLFVRLERGDVEATTSEAVLVEVSYVLASKRQYGLSPAVVIAYLTEAIRLPGLKLSHGKKTQYLRALEIWAEHPALGFVDALTAAIVERSDNELATFDSHFDSMDGIAHWRPDNGHQDEAVPKLTS